MYRTTNFSETTTGVAP